MTELVSSKARKPSIGESEKQLLLRGTPKKSGEEFAFPPKTSASACVWKYVVDATRRLSDAITYSMAFGELVLIS